MRLEELLILCLGRVLERREGVNVVCCVVE